MRGLRTPWIRLALLLGALSCTGRPSPSPSAPPHERIWVPLSHLPLRGPAAAPVTIVVFSDYASPYCARLHQQLSELRKQYPDELRVQFRSRPLPNHPEASLAAEAAMAAAEQGQFFRYHDALFAHPGALQRAALEQYAQVLGLDLSRFRDAIDSERARRQVDADSILAAQLGLRGAPVTVVNGRPLRGPLAPSVLRAVIEEELALARGVQQSGIAPRELYKHIAQHPPTAHPATDSVAPAASPAPPPQLDAQATYLIPLGKSPARGPTDAKVTLVLWSDFECGLCREAESALQTVLRAYPREVRLVWKNRPIPDHPEGMLAAEAALAAAQQGKFWPMHDLLFQRPRKDRQTLDALAEQLALALPAFGKALDQRVYAAQVAADLTLADRVGVRDLPTVFLNGRPLTREQLTADLLKARVRAELQRVEGLLTQGMPRAGLYERLVGSGLAGIPEPTLSELPPLPAGRYYVEPGSSPVRGPAAAPITLVLFADFQCPYCARFEGTVAQLRAHYGDKLRIVWKDAPDAEHSDALGAHEAARAAGEQGRFWEMHDKIVANPYLLDRATMERYAEELGLELEKFRSALAEGRFRRAIQEDTEYGASLAGPAGTPIVFVNGRLLPGAYPLAVFRQIIDEELAQRQAR